MPLIPLFDCQLVDVATQEPLQTVTLPLVPRVGEEMRLRGRGPSSGLYRVASVQYEVEEQQRVRLGHLARVIVGLAPAG